VGGGAAGEVLHAAEREAVDIAGIGPADVPGVRRVGAGQRVGGQAADHGLDAADAAGGGAVDGGGGAGGQVDEDRRGGGGVVERGRGAAGRRPAWPLVKAKVSLREPPTGFLKRPRVNVRLMSPPLTAVMCQVLAVLAPVRVSPGAEPP